MEAQRSIWTLPRPARPFIAWLGNSPMSDSKTPVLPLTLSMSVGWSVLSIEGRCIGRVRLALIESKALEIQVKAKGEKM